MRWEDSETLQNPALRLYLAVRSHANNPTRKWYIWFCPIQNPTLRKTKGAIFSQRSDGENDNKLSYQPVDWAYEVWDDLLMLLEKGDNHQTTIAAQVLSNLAKSDPEQRMVHDLEKLLNVTKDEKFVTARHSLQCLWKVGVVHKTLRDKVLEGLSKRFEECTAEKNCTLIRYDIMEVFRKIYDQTGDDALKETVIRLCKTEPDEKYRKKYFGVWKDIIAVSKKEK